MDIRALVERFLLPVVEKPLRYAGGELNMVRKDPSHAALNGVLCFPDQYDIGMSHAGTQILYHIVNKREQWRLGRAYAPWDDAETIMRERGIPLYDLENFFAVKSADWVGFSVQYELQYANIVNMLDLSGIPLLSKDRSESDPVVIAGGPCMINPEPLADIFDAMLIGDGEEAIVSICETLERMKKSGASRSERVAALAAIEGVYVPVLYPAINEGQFLVPDMAGRTIVPPAKISELSSVNYPDRPLVPITDVIHDRLPVEVQRGCTRGCRFCSAGFYYRPVRERPVGDIEHSIEAGIANSGWTEVGLLSLSTADYSDFSGLVHGVNRILAEKHVSIGLPSTRIDALCDADIKALNTVSAASSYTIAPEAGSQRLRNVINKDFTEETILATVDTLLANNAQTIKLYFMTGLPTETEDDIDAIINLVFAIADRASKKSRTAKINVSVSPYSPKANTPFQWDPMVDPAILMRRGARIKNTLKVKKNIKVDYREASMTRLETIMARGDRRLSSLIIEAWRRGARFDGWQEHFNPSLWDETAVDLGIDLANYLGAIDETAALPWRATSIGVTADYLRAERARALESSITTDCRVDTCTQCGVCGKELAPLFAPHTPETELPPLVVSQKPRPGTGITETGPRFHYRFTYCKDGVERFLSHRNTMDLIIRAFSAASVPVIFSQGFHPLPRVSFGPPLALGASGLAEMFDTILSQEWSCDPALLNRWLPAGLQITDIRPLGGKTTALNASITAAKYVFVPLIPLAREYLENAVSIFAQQSEVLLVVEKDDKTVEKNLRPLVYSIDVSGYDDTDCVSATLSMLPGNTCRPADLLMVLFPNNLVQDFKVVRVECLIEG